jgi:hypothetical protein
MRNHLNAEGIANRIMMRRGVAIHRPFVVVEGDDDAKLYGRLLHHQCALQSAYGKPMVVGTMSVLSSRGADGVVAVVDSDFDRIVGSLPASPHICATELHDAECMLIVSPALDHVLVEYGSETAPDVVRQRLFELARPLGQLRFASHRLEWSVRFDDLPFEKFVDPKGMSLDTGALLEVLRSHQGGRNSAPPSKDELSAAIAGVEAQHLDDLQLCNGHDLQELLALGLRTCWAKHKPSDVTPARVASALRLAFHSTYFEANGLATQLKEWEGKNPAFNIF